MKKEIQTKHRINANIESVWNFIKTGEKWENWLPILTGSRVEGNSRFCDLHNGDVMEEKFLASNVEKTFIYSIEKQESFPARDIVGIIKLEEGDDTGFDLLWSVELEVDDNDTYLALKENIEGIYSSSAAELQKLALV